MAGWDELFDNHGSKIASLTDKEKAAYVPTAEQRQAMAAAGLQPSSGESKGLHLIGVLFDPERRSMDISYYNSERLGSGRPPEPRIGRGLPQWIETGDELVIGNVGDAVYVAKEPIPPIGHALLTDADGTLLTDTADALLTERVEPDLDQLRRDLEAGRLTLTGNPADRRRRQQILEVVSNLRVEVDRLLPKHGGMGHNNPPPDDVEGDPPPEVLQILAVSADAVTTELEKDRPDALEVARSATILRNAGHWLAGKADICADEFAKSFGKSLGTTAAVALVALLSLTVAHLAGWLQAITWPF